MTQPPPNLTSLRARLRNHARDVHALELRVQRRLAALVVNEIFAGVHVGADPPVLLKGGTALDLRRGSARAQLAVGWAGFTGLMAREEPINVPGLAIPPRRFAVKLSYRGKPFATVPVEISAAEASSGDEHDVLHVSEYDSIGIEPTGPIYCLSLRYQIAQKIHACTDPLDGERPNDRARDLVDWRGDSLFVTRAWTQSTVRRSSQRCGWLWLIPRGCWPISASSRSTSSTRSHWPPNRSASRCSPAWRGWPAELLDGDGLGAEPRSGVVELDRGDRRRCGVRAMPGGEHVAPPPRDQAEAGAAGHDNECHREDHPPSLTSRLAAHVSRGG